MSEQQRWMVYVCVNPSCPFGGKAWNIDLCGYCGEGTEATEVVPAAEADRLRAERDARPDLTRDQVAAAVAALDDSITRYGCGPDYHAAIDRLRSHLRLLDEGSEDE